MTHSEYAQPMISQTAQAIATEQPKRTTGQPRAAALANACERFSATKAILRLLVLSDWYYGVKHIRTSEKVTSLCGYLVVTAKFIRPKK
jgi:hypothetical protein